jgi:hypothetical protein
MNDVILVLKCLCKACFTYNKKCNDTSEHSPNRGVWERVSGTYRIQSYGSGTKDTKYMRKEKNPGNCAESLPYIAG